MNNNKKKSQQGNYITTYWMGQQNNGSAPNKCLLSICPSQAWQHILLEFLQFACIAFTALHAATHRLKCAWLCVCSANISSSFSFP